jgi:hypothetical protein
MFGLKIEAPTGSNTPRNSFLQKTWRLSMCRWAAWWPETWQGTWMRLIFGKSLGLELQHRFFSYADVWYCRWSLLNKMDEVDFTLLSWLAVGLTVVVELGGAILLLFFLISVIIDAAKHSVRQSICIFWTVNLLPNYGIDWTSIFWSACFPTDHVNVCQLYWNCTSTVWTSFHPSIWDAVLIRSKDGHPQ